MNDNNQHRIRIKLPNGAEIEAAGSPEFVRTEREVFLAEQRTPKQAQDAAAEAGPARLAWDQIIESKGLNIQLRAKLKDNKNNKDACLVLLAAAHKVLNQSKPTAAQLAKWLRSSGYPVQRVDRAISEAIEKGEIMASGSRRARRYELTGPGRLKAFLLAEQLSDLIA